MKKDHILHLLAEGVNNLSPQQLSLIETHIVDCPACQRAYQAAQISRALLQARAAESSEPSPFFSRRVMAALQEQKRQPETSPFMRLWRATAPILTSMVAAVLILLTLTIFNSYSSNKTAPPDSGAVAIMSGDNPNGDINDNQVFTALSDDAEVIYGN